MKRLTIITDSLGMPRELNPIEETWVELILNFLQNNGGGEK